MNNIIRFAQTLNLMRMVVGICIILDGYPLIFFFRDALRLAPGSTAFTALAMAGGLVLMIPFTIFRKLYRPNTTMLKVGLAYIGMSIFYMFFLNGNPFFNEYDRDMIYYVYILAFIFLLINVPNDIVKVFVPVVVLFTLVSNLGLIYALLTDPSWAIGQRATIVLSNSDVGSGNPHVFARNAFMGLIACAIWLMGSDTNFLFRLLSFFAGVLNIVVIVLTQTRSTMLALILAVVLFMYFNVRPAQIRTAVRGLVKPGPILVMAVGILGIIYFFQRNFSAYLILSDYLISFFERNLGNLYAFLGLKAQGSEFKAVLDDSSANRTESVILLRNSFSGAHIHKLILGYGYKYTYLDVPIVESFTNHGIAGIALFSSINIMIIRHVSRILSKNPNELSTFLAYFYFLILVQIFTNGRPNEITYWFPYGIMIRFMGIEHLFPSYLSKDPVSKPVDSTLLVVQQHP
jgi:hypothetical protein